MISSPETGSSDSNCMGLVPAYGAISFTTRSTWLKPESSDQTTKFEVPMWVNSMTTGSSERVKVSTSSPTPDPSARIGGGAVAAHVVPVIRFISAFVEVGMESV
jgi:hypothetical protein